MTNYEQIILKFQQDIRKGLGALYESYGKSLYGYCLNQWRLSEDESYEILYKTLETVGRVIDRYEFSSERHFMNWLFKIHKNNTLQFIRKAARQRELLDVVSYEGWFNEPAEEENSEDSDSNELSEELALAYKPVIDRISSTDVFSDSSSSSRIMSALEKALLKISDFDRELLLLRMNHYTYDEIATMLGVENNQLKVKFNRAKTKVKKMTLEILKDMP